VAQTLQMLKTSTGLDLEALIQKSVGKAAGGTSAPALDGLGTAGVS